MSESQSSIITAHCSHSTVVSVSWLLVLCEFENFAVTSDAIKRIFTNFKNFENLRIFTNFKHGSHEFSLCGSNYRHEHSQALIAQSCAGHWSVVSLWSVHAEDVSSCHLSLTGWLVWRSCGVACLAPTRSESCEVNESAMSLMTRLSAANRIFDPIIQFHTHSPPGPARPRATTRPPTSSSSPPLTPRPAPPPSPSAHSGSVDEQRITSCTDQTCTML